MKNAKSWPTPPKFPCGCSSQMGTQRKRPMLLKDNRRVCEHGHVWIGAWSLTATIKSRKKGKVKRC
jgi:hypothetical protein